MAAKPTEAAATYYDANTNGAEVKYYKASEYKAGEENWLERYEWDGKAGYYVVGENVTLWTDGYTKASVKLNKKAVEQTDLVYKYKAEAFGETKWSCYTDGIKADYKATKGSATLYFNKFVEGETAVYLLVDGKIVKAYEVTDTKIPAQHLLIYKGNELKATDEVGVFEAVCAACKKTFKISEYNVNGAGYLYKLDAKLLEINQTTGAVEFGPAGNKQTVAIPSGYNVLDWGTWSILNDTAPATDADKTVTSAKTFDAGIALYAGMALASVAGSAVVIGKKKEF